MEMFAALIKDPTGWNLRPFIDDKTLVESKADGPSPVNKCAHYLRLIRLPAEEVFRALRASLLAYPAEAPYTIICLLLLGEDLIDVFRDFTAAMKVFGLEDAIAQFFKHVEENAGATVLRDVQRAAKQTILGYTGIAAAKAPGARVVDDINKGSSHTIFLSSLSTSRMNAPFAPLHASAGKRGSSAPCWDRRLSILLRVAFSRFPPCRRRLLSTSTLCANSSRRISFLSGKKRIMI
ncbi:hypothetical protein FB45DRAFT_325487 [Roridomyces roridus]|uniref:Uncharacterized protein n=1 Tax=Roridomyces roridus TaxID=1738132 RepID=A0AAD7B620_9AGAR|nr:hypothetical protein FB45DRAFT_325487 [Roridomyces roridus]